jgi:hypothetical protein
MLSPKHIPGRPGTHASGTSLEGRLAEPRRTHPPKPRPDPPKGAPSAGQATPPLPAGPAQELAPAIAAAAKYRQALLAKPYVLGVRAGYKFIGGRITAMPAVVVIVDRKVAPLKTEDRIPGSLDGIPTDITLPDPYERLRLTPGAEAGVAVKAPRLLIDELQDATAARRAEEAAEAIRAITYEPPPGSNLDAVTGAMTITCHVSPDAGWRVLEPFLSATENGMSVGMYDFTAPHIYRAARTLLKTDGVTWRQTLGPKESLPAEDDVDSTKADDLTEVQVVRGLRRVALDRFTTAFAHVGSGRTFASAYHIKLAVRDGKAFWLSSGSWQTSNQPSIDFLADDADRTLMPRFNREWHVVVQNRALSEKFEVFLQHDLATAQQPIEEAALAALPDLLIPEEAFFAEERARRTVDVFAPQKFTFGASNPLTVQPILTPDNFIDIVLDLLKKRPSRTLYFQNQSLNPIKEPTPAFKELLRLLAKYSNDDDLDVRIIIRSIGAIRKKLESLKAAGFNMSRIRLQEGCHTKGIIIDSGTILLGSHNFTNEGTQVNRDASLLIRDKGIAGYFERIFLHDWEQLSGETIREETMPVPVIGHEAAPLADGRNYVRVPWRFLEED